MISWDDIKIETVELSDGDDIVVITHLPSGKKEFVDFPASDRDIRNAVTRLSHSVPYSGDPGDESDHERWEGEGGAVL